MFVTGTHHSLTFHQEAIYKPLHRLALSKEQFGIWYLETAIKLHHLYHSVSRGTSIFILVASCRNTLLKLSTCVTQLQFSHLTMVKGIHGRRKHLCSCIGVKKKTVSCYSITAAWDFEVTLADKNIRLWWCLQIYFGSFLLRKYFRLRFTIKACLFIDEFYLGEQNVELPNLTHLQCIEVRGIPATELQIDFFF